MTELKGPFWDQINEACRNLGWVECSERLPPKNTKLILWFPKCGSKGEIGWREAGQEDELVEQYCQTGFVTRWMIFPK